MKKKYIYLLLYAGIMSTKAFAQSGVTATGGDLSGSGGKVSYSAGQLAYTSITSSTGKVSQGIQQAFEIFVVSGLEVKYISLDMKVYPNPTTDFVTLRNTKGDLNQLSFQLLGANGSKISESTLQSENTDIAMRDLAAGIYFIKVYNQKELLKSFQIIKN
jgi:Secretion system C-terminal sorting domain